MRPGAVSAGNWSYPGLVDPSTLCRGGFRWQRLLQVLGERILRRAGQGGFEVRSKVQANPAVIGGRTHFPGLDEVVKTGHD